MALRTRLLPLAAIAAALACAAPAGAANSNSLYVNATADRAAGVDAERLYNLSDASAKRWRLSVLGNASLAAGVRDGTQVIAFSKATNPQALGVTTVWSRTRFKLTTSKRCRTVRGKKRCSKIKRYVKDGTEVIEKDVQLNPNVPWEQGPAYPTVAKYDLESTVLHELGHFANPLKDNHVFGCENSPMIDSIAPGEYWRDSDDWLRYGCSGSTGVVRPKVAAPGTEMRMLVEEHRLPPVYER